MWVVGTRRACISELWLYWCSVTVLKAVEQIPHEILTVRPLETCIAEVALFARQP